MNITDSQIKILYRIIQFIHTLYSFPLISFLSLSSNYFLLPILFIFTFIFFYLFHLLSLFVLVFSYFTFNFFALIFICSFISVLHNFLSLPPSGSSSCSLLSSSSSSGACPSFLPPFPSCSFLLLLHFTLQFISSNHFPLSRFAICATQPR